MPFIITAEPTSWYPVHFNTLDAEGGLVINEIELKLVRLDRDEFAALFRAAGDVSPADELAHNRKVFERVVRDWRGVLIGDGVPAPFEAAYIDAQLKVATFPAAFATAYIDFWSALPAQRLKNFAASPDGGPATPTTTAAAPAMPQP